MSWNAKAGGAWQSVKNGYVKVGGAWMAVKGAWVKADGVWKSVLNGWTLKSENTADPSIYGHLAVVGGNLYYLGGILSGMSSATNRVTKYDPVTDTWAYHGSTGAIRKNDGACVVRGNRYIHVFGGTDSYSAHIAYDTVTGIAATKAAIYASQGPVMGVSNSGDIYAAGGLDGSPRTYLRKWVDNGGTGTTTALTAMPAARAWGLGGCIAEKIYHFGGQDAGGNWMTDGYVFDIEMNSWSTAASLPEAAAHAPHFIKNGKLYYVNNTGHTFIYDPATNSWSQGPDCPLDTYYGKGAASDLYAIAYVHGGFANGTGAVTGRTYALTIT
ncbi:Kelch motif protein [compost metagenome]